MYYAYRLHCVLMKVCGYYRQSAFMNDITVFLVAKNTIVIGIIMCMTIVAMIELIILP